MPVLSVAQWPSIERVAAEGIPVVADADGAVVTVGLLNMMPERAIAATERQFLRLLAQHDTRIVRVVPLHLPELPIAPDIAAVRAQYSQEHAALPDAGLDALIITGANVSEPDLTGEAFWDSLRTTLAWAETQHVPTVCSCLAAHACALLFHNIARQPLPEKCWGIFEHDVLLPDHELMCDLPAHFAMPHSRFNEIPASAFTKAGVSVLAASPDAGVQIAIEADSRRVYFQGHPEYEAISLPKEYRREVQRYFAGERNYPPLPRNTFSKHATARASAFREEALAGRVTMDDFPEAALVRDCTAPWSSVAQTLYRNWLATL